MFKGRELWDKIEETDVAYVKSFDNGSFKGTAVDAPHAADPRRVAGKPKPLGCWSAGPSAPCRCRGRQ